MAEHDNAPAGGIWRRANEHGEYLSLSLELNGTRYRACAYPVREKRSDRAPDYVIRYLRPETSTKPASRGEMRPPARVLGVTDKPQPRSGLPPLTDNDLPF